MSDIVLEVEESQPVEMSVAEQIVMGGGGDVGPATETEWGTVKVAEPIEGHPGYAKITHAKDGSPGTYDFYTPRMDSTSDTIHEDLLPKADTSTYGVVKVYPNDGQQGGYATITYEGGDAIDVPLVGMTVSGASYTETIRNKYLPPATDSAYGAVKVRQYGDPASGLQLGFSYTRNGSETETFVPRINSGTISPGVLPLASSNKGAVEVTGSTNYVTIGYQDSGRSETANLAKMAIVPTSASVDSSGLISFKNSSSTTLFTLQLPIYNGGVS